MGFLLQWPFLLELSQLSLLILRVLAWEYLYTSVYLCIFTEAPQSAYFTVEKPVKKVKENFTQMSKL